MILMFTMTTSSTMMMTIASIVATLSTFATINILTINMAITILYSYCKY